MFNMILLLSLLMWEVMLMLKMPQITEVSPIGCDVLFFYLFANKLRLELSLAIFVVLFCFCNYNPERDLPIISLIRFDIKLMLPQKMSWRVFLFFCSLGELI